MKKLYCKINFERGSTLIRVDSEKEFQEVLPSKEDFIKFFKNLLIKKSQNSSYIPDPYRVVVSEDKFNELTKIIKNKLGVFDQVIASSIDLIYNSNSYTVIQIVKN